MATKLPPHLQSLEDEAIREQHGQLDPKHVDYFSLRVHSKAEKTFDLVAKLTDEGQQIYITGSDEMEARTTPFDYAKDARAFAKRFYPGIEVQRD